MAFLAQDAKKLESAFIQYASTCMKIIAVSIDTARFKQVVEHLINKHIRGKEIPSNATVEVRRNGYVLSNYRDVQHGDTLQLFLVRNGLYGGMLCNRN